MSDNQTMPNYAQMAYFPWQSSVWQKLYSNKFSNKMEINHFPHALLLAGVAGIGKKELAFYLAKGLLCQSPQENPKTGQIEPCQSCRACQLFNSATHPDFNHITTPEDKKVIPVDTIRELIQWSVLSSQLGGKKIILIEPAEAMNPNASNSLLKTLEEPVANTIIILLTNKKQALLPTIRSRCQSIDLALPDKQIALQWLEDSLLQTSLFNSEEGTSENAQLLLSLASGTPLLALELSHGKQLEVRNTVIKKLLSIMNDSVDPVRIAEDFFKQTKIKLTKSKSKNQQLPISAYDVIYWTDSIVSDLARLAQNCERDTISNIDLYETLKQLSNRLYLKKILQLSDLINKAYYEIQGQININLLFEKLLIDWKNCKQ
ncbi:MAG: DNA polymerase III subunit delta' [Gammaproteobacteria bacterium]|nr:DNA polymerase III subunit delta' [Gammaproteobacteria bacterium]